MRHLRILILLISPAVTFSQTDELIKWESSNDLVWSDFKSNPDSTSQYGALTEWGLNYSVKKDINGNNNLYVNAYFNRTTSWVKSRYKLPKVLRHEQQHFNIAEWYARKFKKRYSELSKKGKVQSEALEGLYKAILEECIQVQELYDKETDHGRNDGRQIVWEQKIEKALKKLKKYA